MERLAGCLSMSSLRHASAAAGRCSPLPDGQSLPGAGGDAADGQPSPRQRLKGQVPLGAAAFVEAMRRKVPADTARRKDSTGQSSTRRRGAWERARAVAEAYPSSGYTLRKIGGIVGAYATPLPAG
jgi:hypothetical protein